jgi:hypothetical protein
MSELGGDKRGLMSELGGKEACIGLEGTEK